MYFVLLLLPFIWYKKYIDAKPQFLMDSFYHIIKFIALTIVSSRLLMYLNKLAVCLVCSVGWFARPPHPNTASSSASSKYLREFLDEMQADQISEHLRWKLTTDTINLFISTSNPDQMKVCSRLLLKVLQQRRKTTSNLIRVVFVYIWE